MPRAARPVRILYAAFATSVVGAAAVGALVGAMVAPLSSPGELLAAGWIFAGIAWVLLGWLYAPNVSTYLGPGGTGVFFRGGAGPIIAVSGARPAANPEVLADLGERLSRGTDLGVMLAALGALLFFVGVLAYLDVWLGILGATGLLVLVAALAA